MARRSPDVLGDEHPRSADIAASPMAKCLCLGSIRRECIDHLVVLGERHLLHVLLSYLNYYNAVRTHLSLGKDAPVPRGIQAVGRIVPRPILGGLHHQYVRI